jgi:hypothetical protein
VAESRASGLPGAGHAEAPIPSPAGAIIAPGAKTGEHAHGRDCTTPATRGRAAGAGIGSGTGPLSPPARTEAWAPRMADDDRPMIGAGHCAVYHADRQFPVRHLLRVCATCCAGHYADRQFARVRHLLRGISPLLHHGCCTGSAAPAAHEPVHDRWPAGPRPPGHGQRETPGRPSRPRPFARSPRDIWLYVKGWPLALPPWLKGTDRAILDVRS